MFYLQRRAYLSDPPEFRLKSASAAKVGPTAPSRLPAILFGVWLCGFAAQNVAWWRRWGRVRAALQVASPLHLGLPIRAMSTRFALGARRSRDLPTVPCAAGGNHRTS